MVYGALATLLAVHSERRPPVLALVGACALTALWGLAAGAAASGWTFAERPAAALSAARATGWVVFLLIAQRAGLGASQGLPFSPAALRLGAVVALAIVAVEFVAGSASGSAAGELMFARLSGRLLLAMLGLFLVETLWRGSQGETRWRLRYLCIGVGGFLLFDLFVASEALLFRRLDPMLEGGRAAAAALAAPLVAVAAARNPDWAARLNLGRRAVYHSFVLLGIGVYLCALAGAGALLRMLGGDWVRLVQATVVFSGLLLLAVLLSSRKLRFVTRRWLNSYLFTYRHDYRDTWRRFAETLSAPAAGATLRERALQAVTDIMGSPGGAIWIREGDLFARVAAQTPPAWAEDEPASGAFARELAVRGDVVLDLGELADPRAARHADWIPDWLRSWKAAWVVAPLVHRLELLGFVVLTRSPAVDGLDPEDEELLETLARQVASYLAEERQTRALEDVRRLGDFSRNVAFIAHDLRNLASELSLTLSNARSHIQNPEFQQDLLLGMEESVARMQRLLDRLKSGGREAEAPEQVDLPHLLGDSLQRFAEAGRVALELPPPGTLPVAGQPDRIVAMSGHLVRNALDAAGPEGHVVVRLRRDGDASLFEVEDDGPGMAPEMLRERLHHPFQSTKSTGFGLGLYECRELAQELGGQLEIRSEPGRGTVAKVWLPLAESRQRRSSQDAG